MAIRHPLPLLTNEVPRIALNRQHTILLVQDLHAPFADAQNGWLARRARSKVLLREFDEYFDALDLVAPNIPQLLTSARTHGIGVVYSCLGHSPPQDPSVLQTATGWTWDLSGAAGAFPAAWQPQADEPVFAKPGWSALSDPAFVQLLDERSIQNVLLIGAPFEFGIRQTCLALADCGVGCLVISDAVIALTSAGQRQTAGEIAHGLTKLRSTGETLDLLAQLAGEETVLV